MNGDEIFEKHQLKNLTKKKDFPNVLLVAAVLQNSNYFEVITGNSETLVTVFSNRSERTGQPLPCLSIWNRENWTPYGIIHRKKPGLAFVRILGCRQYLQIERRTCEKKQKSLAQPGVFVGYRRVNAYWVLQDVENKIVELRDVRVFKRDACQLLDEADVDVTEFNVGQDGFIFDDTASNIDPELIMQVTGSGRTKNELSTGVDLDLITYYSNLRASNHRKARNKPEGPRSGVKYVVMDPNGCKKVPVTHKVALKSGSSAI